MSDRFDQHRGTRAVDVFGTHCHHLLFFSR
jgi:hypothetical protein